METTKEFAVAETSDIAVGRENVGEMRVAGDPEAGGGTLPDAGNLGEDVVVDGFGIGVAAGSGAGPLSSEAVEVDPEADSGDDDRRFSGQLSETGSDANNWMGSVSDSMGGAQADF
jgi:hypothetical protein